MHAAVTPGWYTNYHYGWSPSTAVFDDSNASTVVLTSVDVTNFKVFVRVSTPLGCWGSDSAFIIEHPGNFVHLDTSIDLCPRDSGQFQPVIDLTGNDPLTYVWHPGLYLNDSTAETPWVHPTTSQSYFAIVKSQYGCLDTIHANVTVHPAAQIYTGDSVTIYPGESYHIQPQTNCVNFTWFPAAGLDNPHVSDPAAMPAFNTKYKVIGTTEWGCVGEDSISVYFDIHSLLAVPNAFTPGGSVNNTLTLIKRGEATLNYFRIFDRWGNMVFETKNISEGWDGTFHGKPQPLGVYVYEIEAVSNTGSLFKRHGNITLIR